MLLNTFKKLSFILCAGSLLVFTACNGETTENTDTENTEAEVVEETPRNLSDTDASAEQEANENNETSTESEDLPLINNGAEAGVTINPAHGEPGHDCAVPVGQPLPTPGANTSNVETPNEIKTVKLNPPHGEPGHDCAVPVGNPLN